MKFNNRFYFFLFGAIASFLLAFGIEYSCDTDFVMRHYAQSITKNLQDQETDVAYQLKQDSFINHLYRVTNRPPIDAIQSLTNKQYGICLYQKDSLLFWSNAVALPTKELLAKSKSTQKPFLEKLSNGYFVVQRHPLPHSANDYRYAISLIPIKNAYKESLPHLESAFRFPNSMEIPQEIDVTTEPSPFTITSLDNQALFYLQKKGTVTDKYLLRWLMFCYLVAFVFLALVINTVTKKIMQHGQTWMGPAFLLVTVFGLRKISLPWSQKFESFQVFSRSFDNPHISVGDLLINIVLLLWVVIFVHREAKDKTFSADFPNRTRFFLTAMNYLSVILALLLLISVMKSLVLNSGIDFDFKNVFSLDQYSVIAVFGIVLLLFTQFVFSYRMMMTIHQLNLPLTKRLAAFASATLLAFPVILFINLQIPLGLTVIVAFAYVATYDYFMRISDPGLLWLSGWVIFFAIFSAGLLYLYNAEKEENNEIIIAQELAKERDTLAEIDLVQFKLRVDSSLRAKTFVDSDYLVSEEAKLLFATLDFEQNYLYSTYDYEVYIYDEYGTAKNKNAGEVDLATWQKKLTNAQALTNQTNLFFQKDSLDKYTYIFFKKFPNLVRGTQAPQLFFEFKKSGRFQPTVYKKVLSRVAYRGLKNLKKYNYAIIKNGRSIYEQGLDPNEPTFEKMPAIGKHARQSQKELDYFIYRSADNDYVLLSKPQNSFFYPLSIFSFIFGVLCILIVFIALVNSKISILPDNLNFKFWNRPSLKNRIQFSTILLTLFSFLIIGIVSVFLLTESYLEYNSSRLQRKVSGTRSNAEQYLRQSDDSLSLLKNFVKDLAAAERIDFNLFDLDGTLLQSSEPDIFQQGLTAPKMNAYAFEHFKDKDKSEVLAIDNQRIGDQIYTYAFVPLHNSKNQKVAYIGVPYANQERTLNDDVLNFMGYLLNVYVFMLILAGGISVYVAGTITKPITVIGDNLKALKLGKTNKPLEWRTNDEIGALVTEYNLMILKLEHSANLLARSEREGAWREMAKQVAHEIKNPLTPMKLSIQYLQHAFSSNPKQIEPLLKRVSNTLIEQIDSLAQIANEFSNFAKMPRANNRQIILNDLVATAYDLFKESKNTKIQLSLPDEDFYVFADKNHLTRVLNNMIKNAIEAIPDTRQGKIDVSLSKRDQIAVIKVQDNGVGIPEDMQKRVFVPNFTTKNSGTGLGLAISKNIIESVSGKIYFETEKDVGTTFFVELPLEDMVLENK